MKRARVLLVALCAVVAGCASEPALRQSQVFEKPAAKLERLSFVYRRSVMKGEAVFGRPGVDDHDNGFRDFGEVLARQVPESFRPHGVGVVATRQVGGRQPTPALQVAAAGTTNGGLVPVLHVFASRVQGLADATVANVRVSFEAQLLAGESGRLLWQGTIDTMTSRNPRATAAAPGEAYDQTLARKFFETLIARWQADGLL